ncbi:MAG: hypothetical protein LBC45_01420 [Chlamydiales bacterium]|nr:hypothetical protein [Chlamydiales bacterium]
MKKKPHSKRQQYLGDFVISPKKFDQLSTILRKFRSAEFQKLNDRKKSERINSTLYELIHKEQTPCFLLPAVLNYIEAVHTLALLDNYAFFHFELWLNQFSGMSVHENYLLRAKIVGKWIPREEYQSFFPIGMDRVYQGSHFVTAHGSPDLDTVIASFWGWVDAFAARVGNGLHIWNVPGGPPSFQVEIDVLFDQMLGKKAFVHLAEHRTTLVLSGIDLVTQNSLTRQLTTEPISLFDHEHRPHAIILVDKQGYYLGDWHHYDVEGVRQVIALLNNCLRWFENDLHVKLVSLFAKKDLSLKDLPEFIHVVLMVKIEDCQPAREFTEGQKKHAHAYLYKVLSVKKGLSCTFQEFAEAMKAHDLLEFAQFLECIASLNKSSLFNASGFLIENRPRIFLALEKMIQSLDRSIQSICAFMERLEVALDMKTHVFGHVPQHVNYRAEIEEIRSKMNNYPYLTVTMTDSNGKVIPLGVIYANDLHKNLLGTVSLRDFCNREETKIPAYFEVISVIDHHKSHLQTLSAPLAVIADVQSCNVLCAELSFAINDKYGTGGMNLQQIQGQIKEKLSSLHSVSDRRILQRLLQRENVCRQKNTYFIDPTREMIEYFHFLYAIFEDTDLLTKVSRRDIDCVASLVNRLKSLILKEEVEVILFDDIDTEENFVSLATKRILQNRDVYSIYYKIYKAKEENIEKNIKLCIKGKPSSIFVDTKEQNGCARVGQTKIFARNYPSFSRYVATLQEQWYKMLFDYWSDHPEVDLHLQMISTIAGAEHLFSGKEMKDDHLDELWIWIPFTEQSIERLKKFLNAFRSCLALVKGDLAVCFYGDTAKAYEQIFVESFFSITKKEMNHKESLPIAVLKFPAGSINSRKAMISPCLPRTD